MTKKTQAEVQVKTKSHHKHKKHHHHNKTDPVAEATIKGLKEEIALIEKREKKEMDTLKESQ